jgi:hypothetical protein
MPPRNVTLEHLSTSLKGATDIRRQTPEHRSLAHPHQRSGNDLNVSHLTLPGCNGPKRPFGQRYPFTLSITIALLAVGCGSDSEEIAKEVVEEMEEKATEGVPPCEDQAAAFKEGECIP